MRGSRIRSVSWGPQHIIRWFFFQWKECAKIFCQMRQPSNNLIVNFRATSFLKISRWRNNLATSMSLDGRISQSHFTFYLTIWSGYACHLIAKSSNENGPFNELHTMHNCCKTLTSFMQMILWRSLISFWGILISPKQKNIYYYREMGLN